MPDFAAPMIKKLGKVILYVPTAKAWHKIGSEKINNWGIYHLYRGRVIFYRKHSGGFHRLLLIIYAFLYIIYRAIFKVPHEPIFPAIGGLMSGLKQTLIFGMKNKDK